MIQEDVLHGVLIKSLISQDSEEPSWQDTINFHGSLGGKSLLIMLKGNGCGAKEGEITIGSKLEPRVVWIKFFLSAHGITEMGRNTLLGICRGCTRTMVRTHRIIPTRS